MNGLNDVPTWKLILLLIGEAIKIVLPLILAMTAVVMVLRTCGDMPY